jgi:uncharacterized ferritin-like protein (DUF455 family)
MSVNLFAAARACLALTDPVAKAEAARGLDRDWHAGALTLEAVTAVPELIDAGRPARPELVAPRDLPRRRLGSAEGQAAMLHAIAHIEFNAINLACDAVFRFRDLPRGFYADWIRVAAEEANHFNLLNERLAELGHAYGDFPAHSGLWDLAVKTRHDPLVRMALVPRVMEARGLDVTPEIQRKFAGVGDERSVAILDVILREEVGHVAAGSRWFGYLCDMRGLEPESTYFELLAAYFGEGVRCPLHRQARLEAGFSESELRRLEALCAERAAG